MTEFLNIEKLLEEIEVAEFIPASCASIEDELSSRIKEAISLNKTVIGARINTVIKDIIHDQLDVIYESLGVPSITPTTKALISKLEENGFLISNPKVIEHPENILSYVMLYNVTKGSDASCRVYNLANKTIIKDNDNNVLATCVNKDDDEVTRAFVEINSKLQRHTSYKLGNHLFALGFEIGDEDDNNDIYKTYALWNADNGEVEYKVKLNQLEDEVQLYDGSMSTGKEVFAVISLFELDTIKTSLDEMLSDYLYKKCEKHIDIYVGGCRDPLEELREWNQTKASSLEEAIIEALENEVTSTLDFAQGNAERLVELLDRINAD